MSRGYVSTIPRIALIPGDGIGGEVLAEGVRVLDALGAFEYTEFPWGSAYYAEHGRMMAEDGLERLAGFDAIFFGAVGSREVPDHVTLWGLRLAIVQGFDLWANVRPVEVYAGVPARLPPGLEWVCVRENSEGEYAGIGGRNLAARGNEVAIQTSIFTEQGCERIMRFAFSLARERRRKVTSVTKSNAQQYGMVLWDEVFARVAAEHADVETERVLVDAMAARFVLAPETLDVVVASNLHGDILSDLGSALAGSLGLAASANLDPQRRSPSLFEPVHGSAPDIVGRGVANPIGAIGSAALLLDHLGLEGGDRVRAAIAATLRDGVLTRDLGGRARTHEVTDAILKRL